MLAAERLLVDHAAFKLILLLLFAVLWDKSRSKIYVGPRSKNVRRRRRSLIDRLLPRPLRSTTNEPQEQQAAHCEAGSVTRARNRDATYASAGLN